MVIFDKTQFILKFCITWYYKQGADPNREQIFALLLNKLTGKEFLFCFQSFYTDVCLVLHRGCPAMCSRILFRQLHVYRSQASDKNSYKT